VTVERATNPWADWIGRTETVFDSTAPGTLQGLAALLDHDTSLWREGEVPPLGHWLYFLPRARQSTLDMDGHPQRGDFMPPITLSRRMWAGSVVTFHAALPVGVAVDRRSTIMSVTPKSGASGNMVFVAVRQEVIASGKVVVTEVQDIVYREPASKLVSAAESAQTPPTSRATIPTPDKSERMQLDPVQLFRFSALTFNAHRIHYDREYTREVEGYPGLIVQGQYAATLLMDFFLRHFPHSRIATFSFRARQPMFDGVPFDMQLARTPHGANLWIVNPQNQITLTAEIITAT